MLAYISIYLHTLVCGRLGQTIRLTPFLVFSSSLCEGKLCRLHLLLLLLASHLDQGEKRKHHPSFQKPLHLHRQQVGAPAPAALWFGTVSPQHSSVPTREFFSLGVRMSSPSQRVRLPFTAQRHARDANRPF